LSALLRTLLGIMMPVPAAMTALIRLIVHKIRYLLKPGPHKRDQPVCCSLTTVIRQQRRRHR